MPAFNVVVTVMEKKEKVDIFAQKFSKLHLKIDGVTRTFMLHHPRAKVNVILEK